MSKQTASQGLLAAFVGLCVIQVARAASAEGGWTWPKPSVFVAPAIIYSMLSLVAAASAPLAVALAVGIDLATAVAPAAALAVETAVGNMLHVPVSANMPGTSATGQMGADAKAGYMTPQIVQGTVSSNNVTRLGVTPS